MTGRADKQPVLFILLAAVVLVVAAYILLGPRRAPNVGRTASQGAATEGPKKAAPVAANLEPQEAKPIAEAKSKAGNSAPDSSARSGPGQDAQGRNPEKTSSGSQGPASAAGSKTEVTHPSQASVETRGSSGSPKPSGTERSTGGASGRAGASVDIAGGDQVVSLAPDPAPSATLAAPGTALDQAKGLLSQAEKAAKGGDYVTAYERALSGWQKVNPHATADPGCRELAESLLGRLRQYGEKINRNAGVTDGETPIQKPLRFR